MCRLLLVIFVSIPVVNALEEEEYGSVVKLSKANWEEAVHGGKNALVRFTVPSCGSECKSMEKDWEKLARAYSGSTSLVVCDVDCGAKEAKSVCTAHGVSDFPTVMYFKPATGKDGSKYSGERTYDSLEKFAQDNFGKVCDHESGENCDDQRKSDIDMITKASLQGHREYLMKKLVEVKAEEAAELKAAEKAKALGGEKKGEEL